MHLARSSLVAIAIAMTAAVTTESAQAQQLSDWQRGRNLARQVCAECHWVERRPAHSPNPRSPTFADVASTPGMTAIALNVILHTSHRYMPNIILNDEQSNAVITYILSLKR
jgi:mono/diheme cytochrome c family protein